MIVIKPYGSLCCFSSGKAYTGFCLLRGCPKGAIPVRCVHFANVVSSLLCTTLLLTPRDVSWHTAEQWTCGASTGACVHEQASRNWSAEYADSAAHPQSKGFWTGSGYSLGAVMLLQPSC